MKRKLTVNLSVAVALMLAGSVSADVSSLDFDHTTLDTESGWTSLDVSSDRYDTTPQNLGGGISAGFSGFGVASSRDRGQSAGHPADARDLLRDFIFGMDWISGSTPDFSVRGLSPGVYDVTIISGDHDGTTGNVDLVVLDSGTPTASASYDMALVNLGDAVSDLDDVSSTVQVTLAAGEWLVIDGTSGNGSVAGMIIESVPEPATLGFLALGGMALAGTSIRRRRA